MKSVFTKYKHYFILIVIGLLWVCFLDFVLQIKFQSFVFPDSESYILASENLYYLHKSDIIRPSLIAAINGFPLLFGYSIYSLFLWNTVINLIFWLAIVVLVYKIILICRWVNLYGSGFYSINLKYLVILINRVCYIREIFFSHSPLYI